MYESFYGFREKPFSLLPDAGFLYFSSKHRMALTLLEYGIMNQAGFTVISGDIGTGKTTLIRQLLNNIDPLVTVGLISNTHRTFGDLMQWIALAFSLPHQDKDKVQLYREFMEFIISEYAQGRRTVLIVDEAQNMSAETLEELRMLSNVNADKDQVLQVILVGQRELRDTLRRPDLVQFAQRIGVDYHLEPLTAEETRDYIRHRCKVAGGPADLFSDQACQAVFEYCGGVPRLVNLLCDTALVYGYAEQRDRIDAKLVRDVARDKQRGGLFPGAGAPPGHSPTADQSAEPRRTNPEQTEPQQAEPQRTEPQRTEPQRTEPQRTEPRQAEPLLIEPRTTTYQPVTPPPTDKPTGAAPAAAGHRTAQVAANTSAATAPAVSAIHQSSAEPRDSSGLRIAIVSESELRRIYLSKLLSQFGIEAVAALALSAPDLHALETETIDVLLVELEDNLDHLYGTVFELLENWDKPVFFNDSLATEASLSQPNRLAYGRALSQKLYALVPQAPQSVA